MALKGNYAQKRVNRYKKKVNFKLQKDWKKAPSTTKVAYDVARSVVKKALARETESKFRDLTYAITVLRGTDIHVANPLYYIPVNVTESDRIGDELQNVKLHMKGTYYHRGCTSLQADKYQGSTFRMIVFKSNRQWRQGSEGGFDIISGGSGPDALLPQTIFRGSTFSGDNLCNLFPNLNSIKVLYDNTLRSSRYGSTFDSSTGQPINVTIPLGNVQYETSTTGSFIRGDQIYVAIMASSLETESSVPNVSEFLGYFTTKVAITWRDS